MFPLRTLFFAINFGTAILFIASCVISVGSAFVGSGTPFAFLGGICFAFPAIGFAIAEWFFYMRQARTLERPLGVVCMLVGAMAVFAFVSNLLEAIFKGGSPGILFWVTFGSSCFAIATYTIWCGWLRVRRRTFPTEQGFPIAMRR